MANLSTPSKKSSPKALPMASKLGIQLRMLFLLQRIGNQFPIEFRRLTVFRLLNLALRMTPEESIYAKEFFYEIHSCSVSPCENTLFDQELHNLSLTHSEGKHRCEFETRLS